MPRVSALGLDTRASAQAAGARVWKVGLPKTGHPSSPRSGSPVVTLSDTLTVSVTGGAAKGKTSTTHRRRTSPHARRGRVSPETPHPDHARACGATPVLAMLSAPLTAVRCSSSLEAKLQAGERLGRPANARTERVSPRGRQCSCAGAGLKTRSKGGGRGTCGAGVAADAPSASHVVCAARAARSCSVSPGRLRGKGSCVMKPSGPPAGKARRGGLGEEGSERKGRRKGEGRVKERSGRGRGRGRAGCAWREPGPQACAALPLRLLKEDRSAHLDSSRDSVAGKGQGWVRARVRVSSP